MSDHTLLVGGNPSGRVLVVTCDVCDFRYEQPLPIDAGRLGAITEALETLHSAKLVAPMMCGKASAGTIGGVCLLMADHPGGCDDDPLKPRARAG